MPSSYSSDDTRAELQDLWALLELSRAAIVQSDTPLVRTKFIDGDTVTPSASANGSVGRPYASVSAFFTAIGNNASVADANQMFLGLVSPATAAAYTENPTVPAYRNVTVECLSFGGTTLSNLQTGNWTWDNTALAGGVNAGTTSGFFLQNGTITGTFTYTDDAGAPAVTTIGFVNAVPSTSLNGNFTATGGTKLATFIAYNAAFGGNVVSTANATGASVLATNSSFSGTITAKNGNFTQCSFIGGVANVLTFNSGATPKFIDCNFSGGSIVAGATGVITFDGQSWNSFLEAGGVITSGIVLVVGGSQQGLVRNATSLGNADVNISLNGTGASAGLTGGGNFYVESTALTGGHTVTVKTGGGELTGDTIDIVKTDTAAQTYTVKNNAATTLAICPVSSKCWFRVQFNTVVPNDWGLVGGGAGFT